MILFEFAQNKTSLVFLFIGSSVLGYFVACLDPFINLWDEQYHALVAKNLIKSPFRPVLIETPLFGFIDSYWSYCHIWMHKQPLFLWQMAVSLKVFGLTEIGVRFPSILMHALLPFFIYRVGKITVSSRVGYYSALLYTCAYFPLEYITGFYATDHNDIAFLFYSFMSMWALVEYIVSKSKTFLILIGIASGCAIMCKWLTGLTVYLVWFILICTNCKKEGLYKEFLRFLLSFLICCVVFLPWQFYAYYNYPKEYRYAMDFNTKHIFEPLEGHGGNGFFYYDALFEQFGEGLLIPSMILLSFLYMVFLLKNKNNQVLILSTVLITYCFFSFVKTKMYGYVFLVFPFFVLGLTSTVQHFLDKINSQIKRTKLKIPLNFFVMLIIAFFLFNHHKIYKHHGNTERYKSRLIDIKEKNFYIALKEKFGDNNCLLFNCCMSFQSQVLGIFYTNYPSFDFILSSAQIQKAKSLKYILIAIDNGKLPKHIKEDRGIIKIKF
jgi:4-amino-4-deoxy-L-arabinose transferase-like glycosyltransferase